jgi:hypothetical protein
MSQEKDTSNEVHRFWEELGIPISTIGGAIDPIKHIMKAGKFPGLIGHAGIGKTSVLRQLAAEYGGGYFALYLQLCDRGDVLGLPFRDPDGKSFSYLQQKGLVDKMNQYSGGIVVLEELNRADKDTAAAAFAFMDNFHLWFPKGWHLALAMNPSGGQYATDALTTDPAMTRRIQWLAVQEDRAEWLRHAEKNKYHPMVISYIQSAPKQLLNIRLRAAGKIYGSPAAWEGVSKVLYGYEEDNPEVREFPGSIETAVASAIGGTVAQEFMRFVNDNNIVIQPTDVLENYAAKNADVRKRVRTALRTKRVDVVSELIDNLAVTMRSSRPQVTRTLAKNIVTFMKDLPADLQVVMVHNVTSDTDPASARWSASLSQMMAQDPAYITVVRGIVGKIGSVEDSMADDADNK